MSLKISRTENFQAMNVDPKATTREMLRPIEDHIGTVSGHMVEAPPSTTRLAPVEM